jgi:mono/diheme cytochrome c family protein/uncharacterized cupredoxin-like copper-binding protein
VSEPRTGRELAPRPSPEESVERFSAPQTAHTIGLTEERAAEIVTQSGKARFVALFAVLLIVLFIPVYWLYEQGMPALGVTGRQTQEATAQQVTAIQRGNYLFVANCARCHGPNGQGGVGPPLNDQSKLYNAVLPSGQSGAGHLNPNYISTVLTVGGRYVCGDANSLMPVWSNVNGGPLNYQQIAELVAFITASKDVSWSYQPPAVVGASPAPVETHQGWRDPNYQPPPGATPVPACWRNPTGQIGGSWGGAAPSSSPGTITNPGTAANPRVIKLNETAQLTITGADGQPVSTIPVKKGETVRFEVTNTAGFTHNFYVGLVADLEANTVANLKGIPDFSTGTQTLDVTFDKEGGYGFGCLVPGHYQTMHGTFQVVP